MAVGVAIPDATAPACRVLNAVHGAYHRARDRWCLQTYNRRSFFANDVEKNIIELCGNFE
jgi:hypothetical protein